MSMPRKSRCTVAAIAAHGSGVYTVDLQPESPVPIFRAGQFLHLTVDDYDPAGFWPESRVFSIASSQRDRSRLRICYSVKGRYTTRMERMLAVGTQLWVKLPYGEFVVDDTQDAVLIAGGTGISAFTAFIEALTPHPTAGAPRVTLVYGARSPDLWLFRDMLDRQAHACPFFSALFFSESGLPAALHPPGLRILPGRISLDALFAPHGAGAAWAEARAPTLFYLSGPPPMLAALATDLQARGVEPSRIRTDAWD